MKRLFALGLAVLIVLTGCVKALKIQNSSNSSKNINTSNINTEVPSKSDSGKESNTNLQKQEAGSAGDEADKIQSDVVRTSEELDKLLDSLEDLDESKLNF